MQAETPKGQPPGTEVIEPLGGTETNARDGHFYPDPQILLISMNQVPVQCLGFIFYPLSIIDRGEGEL